MRLVSSGSLDPRGSAGGLLFKRLILPSAISKSERALCNSRCARSKSRVCSSTVRSCCCCSLTRAWTVSLSLLQALLSLATCCCNSRNTSAWVLASSKACCRFSRTSAKEICNSEVAIKLLVTAMSRKPSNSCTRNECSVRRVCVVVASSPSWEIFCSNSIICWLLEVKSTLS